MTDADPVRCPWAGADPLYQSYHDTEWGYPVESDTRLFEKLCLEGFQSGLSWLTILKKRENFRAAFARFDIDTVAAFDEPNIDRLLADAGIVRHRGKIVSTINNARRAQALRDEFGSLATYFWSFEPRPEDRPTDYSWDSLRQQATSPESIRLSKDLKKRGFSFVGPTTCYAFMQAMGMVNDHVEGCHCRAPIEAQRARFVRP
ncbi:MAG: DNA-3-methyladenine glycosylase I [Pelagibacterium sp.]|uniref:DNA-3-methyladenine glycosylase I n=1 Tax=uncultured Pelagibacterium sp. TaxID=1159875 RepID=UPI000C5EE501|nr:DNA-3-methyladenine glycosylase I [Pelagibacterium sp.]|tara:strand:- start:27901 stop:28509 length:609 start_codon:yes stop_codon:yes gene_type:complete